MKLEEARSGRYQIAFWPGSKRVLFVVFANCQHEDLRFGKKFFQLLDTLLARHAWQIQVHMQNL